MQLIKEKYRSVGKDISIKIPLGANVNPNGLQQAINEYIERETGLSINEVEDGETFRFRSTTNRSIRPYFWDGATLDDTLLNAGFTQNEIDNKDDVLTDSFYILQVYDSIISENQTLLHNSYYNGNKIEFASSTVLLAPEDEVANFYIPEWFINENNDGSNTINVYVKLLFFNAKTGKLQVFYNYFKETSDEQDKEYFDGTIFLSDRTYTLETNALRFSEYKNQAYIDKVNESLNSFENQVPQFPAGNKFNEDGTYEEFT